MATVQQRRRKLKENNHPEDATDTRSSLKPDLSDAISPRKKQNFVDFPVEGLSLRARVLSDRPSASCSLCTVSNHFGTEWWTIPATVGLPMGCLVQLQ